MRELTDEEKARYLHRSYTAVDGLWFVKAEERHGFDEAFRLDHEVWKVMAKIQARALKSLLGVDRGLEALCDCFGAKLSLDGFDFETAQVPGGRGFRLQVSRCPWHGIRLRAGRDHLFEARGHVICETEYSVWAAEFGPDITFKFGPRLCKGAAACVLEFLEAPGAGMPRQDEEDQ